MNDMSALYSSDPDTFAAGLRWLDFHPLANAYGFRRVIGHHRICVMPGNPLARLSAKNWAVELDLNGQPFNRWSAANFYSVGQAVEYAVEIIEALAAVDSRPRAPAGIHPAIWAALRPMGFDIEGGGAGVPFLSCYVEGAGCVAITDEGGTGLPTPDSWLVGVYGAEGLGTSPIWVVGHRDAHETTRRPESPLVNVAEAALATAVIAKAPEGEG